MTEQHEPRCTHVMFIYSFLTNKPYPTLSILVSLSCSFILNVIIVFFQNYTWTKTNVFQNTVHLYLSLNSFQCNACVCKCIRCRNGIAADGT